ncbi:MAG: translation initiation factor IF-2, partial [Anaerolineae bacterium]
MAVEKVKVAQDDAEAQAGKQATEIPEALTVRDLAERLGISPIDIIKELMNNGIMATINQQIDFDTAAIVGEEMGFTIVPESAEEEALEESQAEIPLHRRLIANEDPADLKLRPPVVTVLGHVDHGKTTLLDVIRKTNVVGGESGGITQHIGAYQVAVNGKLITFLDTPGHQAFTAMRARGAQVTDLAILIVAADDGVMPQTREAIDHARAAQVPILVALNKIDKANARPERVKQELADAGLVVEDWGGEVICVPISAKEEQGIDELLENILLVTDVADLKANPDRPAQGTVIEGEIDEKRGVKATLLVQNGTLRVGDVVLIGDSYGRIRAMFNDKGQRIKEAKPSAPVSILGLPQVPSAGDFFEVIKNEKNARQIVAERSEQKQARATNTVQRPLTLEAFFSQTETEGPRELNIILKADVQGSLEPIVNSLQDLGGDNLKIRLLHQSAGNISETDVNLAVASQAIIVGFNVQVDAAARRTAEKGGIDIRLYDVIYKLIDDIDKALKGLLEPVYGDKVVGHAEVRAVFRIPKRGRIAGSYVLDGLIRRNAFARLLRNEEPVYEGKIASLKRFTEDAREVAAGYECGIGLESFQDFQEGDIIEVYIKEQIS